MNLPAMRRDGLKLVSEWVLVTCMCGTQLKARLILHDGYELPQWCNQDDQGNDILVSGVIKWRPMATER